MLPQFRRLGSPGGVTARSKNIHADGRFSIYALKQYAARRVAGVHVANQEIASERSGDFVERVRKKIKIVERPRLTVLFEVRQVELDGKSSREYERGGEVLAQFFEGTLGAARIFGRKECSEVHRYPSNQGFCDGFVGAR